MCLLLEGIGAHIDALASLHQILATNRLQSSTDLGQQLRNICNAFGSGLSSDSVFAEDFEPGCDLPLDKILPVTQIFSEAITNAIKHGHRNGKAGTIRVRCSKEVGGTILMEVIDEGGGLPPECDPTTSKGLGFRLVRLLSKQVGGFVDYQSSDSGLRFQLTLPPSSTARSCERKTAKPLSRRLMERV